MATPSQINDAFEAERRRLGRPMTFEEVQALDAKLAAGRVMWPADAEDRSLASMAPAKREATGCRRAIDRATSSLEALDARLADYAYILERLDRRLGEMRQFVNAPPDAAEAITLLDELLTLLGYPGPP